MSLILDNRQNNMDTEAEVAKLQLLVKQLELQNEELRSERSGSKPPPTQDEVTLSNIDNIDNSVHCTDLEVMEPLDTTALSDDENWLFESPKAKPHNEDWLRKDMDDPTLGGTRKTLLQKLDQIALSPRASPLHSRSPGSSSGSILSPESPPSSRGEIDTRTFVRPKKKRSIPYGEINDENRNMLIKKEAGSRECLARSSGSLGSEEDDRMSSASDGSFSYRLTDVEDVNAVARLQEENEFDEVDFLSLEFSKEESHKNQTVLFHCESEWGSGFLTVSEDSSDENSDDQNFYKGNAGKIYSSSVSCVEKGHSDSSVYGIPRNIPRRSKSSAVMSSNATGDILKELQKVQVTLNMIQDEQSKINNRQSKVESLMEEAISRGYNSDPCSIVTNRDILRDVSKNKNENLAVPETEIKRSRSASYTRESNEVVLRERTQVKDEKQKRLSLQQGRHSRPIKRSRENTQIGLKASKNLVSDLNKSRESLSTKCSINVASIETEPPSEVKKNNEAVLRENKQAKDEKQKTLIWQQSTHSRPITRQRENTQIGLKPSKMVASVLHKSRESLSTKSALNVSNLEKDSSPEVNDNNKVVLREKRLIKDEKHKRLSLQPSRVSRPITRPSENTQIDLKPSRSLASGLNKSSESLNTRSAKDSSPEVGKNGNIVKKCVREYDNQISSNISLKQKEIKLRNNNQTETASKVRKSVMYTSGDKSSLKLTCDKKEIEQKRQSFVEINQEQEVFTREFQQIQTIKANQIEVQEDYEETDFTRKDEIVSANQEENVIHHEVNCLLNEKRSRTKVKKSSTFKVSKYEGEAKRIQVKQRRSMVAPKSFLKE